MFIKQMWKIYTKIIKYFNKKQSKMMNSDSSCDTKITGGGLCLKLKLI